MRRSFAKPVGDAVDPAVERERLSPLPGILHDGRARDVMQMLDDVELALAIDVAYSRACLDCPLWRIRRRHCRGAASWRLSAQRLIRQSKDMPMHTGAPLYDLFEGSEVDRVLQHRQHWSRVHDDVRPPCDGRRARPAAVDDLVGGNAAVRARSQVVWDFAARESRTNSPNTAAQSARPSSVL